jgi:hypothetical protein
MLQNEEDCNLYRSPFAVRILKSRRQQLDNGDKECIQILVGKCLGRCPLEILRKTWESNITLNHRKVS